MATKGPRPTPPRKTTARGKAPINTAEEAVKPPLAAEPVTARAPRPPLAEPAAPTPAEIVSTAAEAPAKAVEAAKATAENVAAPVITAVAEAAETNVEAAVEGMTGTAQAVMAAADINATPADKETQPMTDMKTAADATTQKAQFMFADMNERAKAAMEKSAKMAEEMNDLAKGNMEAMVESSRIAAKGVESMGQDAAEYSRKSFEHATAAMKNMASVKSPTELFKLQSDYVRTAFDAYVAEASKATEQMLKLSSDAMQPLSNRMAVAADKVKTVA
ncbi:TIGR01841 family phasin [Sphingomonas sp.]|uniref:phasin family protein n=1 Tax=Sphingomonas sp. TaxID=28214 RepID=UPI002B59B1BE|nr:TIGR01841 family phasin [Sphingomonas sp.]HTG39475.1 TIGR01841 family phasin [Sphingomonas sp.]